MVETRKVFKYPVVLKPHFELEMPWGAQILGAFYQGDEPQLWAWVDPDERKITRTFKLYGTGSLIERPEKLRHICTFPSPGEVFIWHLFEVIV